MNNHKIVLCCLFPQNFVYKYMTSSIKNKSGIAALLRLKKATTSQPSALRRLVTQKQRLTFGLASKSTTKQLLSSTLASHLFLLCLGTSNLQSHSQSNTVQSSPVHRSETYRISRSSCTSVTHAISISSCAAWSRLSNCWTAIESYNNAMFRT